MFCFPDIFFSQKAIIFKNPCMKVAYISSNLTQSISLKSHSHLSKSSLHPCSFIMFCCCLIFNVFTLSSTEVLANLNAAILFYSRYNSVTSIQRTNYSYLKVISTGNYSKYLKNLRSAVSVLNLWNAEMSRRSVSYIAEYQFSPDGHRDIFGSRVSCLNQWKCDILVRWKTNVHSVLFLNSKKPHKIQLIFSDQTTMGFFLFEVIERRDSLLY